MIAMTQSTRLLCKHPVAPVLALAMAAVSGAEAEPVAMLDPFEPGLQVTFDVAGDSSPVDWGVTPGGSGFVIANGVATNSAVNALLDYQTTTKGSSTVQALGDTEDWVFSCQWQTDATAQSPSIASVFGLSGPGGDLVQFRGINDAGQYIFMGGDGSGDYVQIGDPITYSNGVLNDLILHYKADVGAFDFWSNGVLVKTNVASRTGTYEVDFVRIRGGGSSFTRYLYDNILIGPTNPPAPPFPQRVASRPALDVHFGTDLTPGEYGVNSCATGFSVSGGAAVSSDTNSVLCYQTGWFGTSSSAMLEHNEDWVCTVVWETDGTVPGPTVFELSGPGGDIARVVGTGTAGVYAVEGGDGGGAYVQIGATIPFTAGVPHELTCHYQASAGLLDFWVDGVKVRTNFPSRSAGYRLDTVQLRGGTASATVDRFDWISVGPFGVPADEPGPRFGVEKQGLLVDFNTDGDANPTDWGVSVSGDGFVVNNGVATNSGDSATLRYRTTMTGSTNVVALSDTNDWAFSMRWDSDFGGEASTVFGLGAPGDQDIALFIGNGPAGRYRLLAGDGSDNYVQIGDEFILDPGEMHILTLHYVADQGSLNFWLDGSLARTNFPGRKGFYNLEFIQIRGGSPKSTRDIFDDVRASSLAVAAPDIAILSIGRGDANQVVIEWDSASDRVYAVDRTQDLTAGLTNTVASGISATPSSNTYTDDVTGVDGAAYRVRDVTE